MNLKQIRLLKKYTQQEVADALNISVQAYSHYETGRREPDFNTLTRLSDFFDVSTDYLLGKEDKLDKPVEKENTVRIIGRGGTVKEFNVPEEQLNAIKTLLENYETKFDDF